MSGICASFGIDKHAMCEVLKRLYNRGQDGSFLTCYPDESGIYMGYTHNATAYNKGPVPSEPFICNDWKLIYDGRISHVRDSFDLTDGWQIVSFLNSMCSDYGEINAVLELVSVITSGSISAVAVSPGNRILAFRDIWGLRPLHYAFNGRQFVVASETYDLEALDDAFEIIEVKPGQVVVFNPVTCKIKKYQRGVATNKASCVLEIAYGQSPKSYYKDWRIEELRWLLGYQLGLEQSYFKNRLTCDIVVGVPNTGLPAAQGYAEAIKKPFVPDALRVNPSYKKGRSFLYKTQGEREEAASAKFIANPKLVSGKKVVAIDDSIFRGTVLKSFVSTLKNARASCVDVRSATPVVVDLCDLGVNIPTRDELLFHSLSQTEIRMKYGIRSLSYLSIPGMYEVVGTEICARCFAACGPGL